MIFMIYCFVLLNCAVNAIDLYHLNQTFENRTIPLESVINSTTISSFLQRSILFTESAFNSSSLNHTTYRNKRQQTSNLKF